MIVHLPPIMLNGAPTLPCCFRYVWSLREGEITAHPSMLSEFMLRDFMCTGAFWQRPLDPATLGG